jgi:16S rRNA (adenine1518-N6/adenine1519-N6)-dimethyltransferase
VIRPGGDSSGVLGRLRKAGLLPRKALGQHFLHDPKLLAALAAEADVGPGDSVLEIGTGPGTLTRELARRAARVLTVEVDPRLLQFARRELEDLPNVVFHEGSVLEGRGKRLSMDLVDRLHALEPFLWVSNLPYNIAATLIVLLLESTLSWSRASLLVQDEVAGRIAAGPGEEGYGPTSALVAFWAGARRGRRVPAGAFWPPPRVTSRVLRIERREPLAPPGEYPAYRAWVRRLFAGRRKQIGHILRGLLGPEGDRRLEGWGWDPARRPETLAPGDFLRLAREAPLPAGRGAGKARGRAR